jgi:hypothetical protein
VLYNNKLTFFKKGCFFILFGVDVFNCFYVHLSKNRAKMIRKISLILAISTLLISCKKIEGQGGSSEIVGNVYIQDKDINGNEVGDKYPAIDENVFIIYGPDGNLHNDDYSSSFDGSYRFEFLTNGTYKIFAYQECVSCQSGDEAVIKTVTIDSKNSSVVVPDIVLDNY